MGRSTYPATWFSLVASSGYLPSTQSTLSEITYSTDLVPLHMKPYGEESPDLAGSIHTDASVGPLSPKLSERKENIDQSKTFLKATLTTRKPTKSGYHKPTLSSKHEMLYLMSLNTLKELLFIPLVKTNSKTYEPTKSPTTITASQPPVLTTDQINDHPSSQDDSPNPEQELEEPNPTDWSEREVSREITKETDNSYEDPLHVPLNFERGPWLDPVNQAYRWGKIHQALLAGISAMVCGLTDLEEARGCLSCLGRRWTYQLLRSHEIPWCLKMVKILQGRI